MMHLMRRRIALSLLAALGVALTASAFWQRPLPKIIYNPSASAPRGWYLVESPAEFHRGDFALVDLPEAIARLADQRKYLPKTVPLLKNIGAVAGDKVCEQQGIVRINGAPIAQALSRDGAGRVLVPWTDCRDLLADELFLVGTTSAASFDSRYYGPIHAESVIGVAIPVWIW